ncbi:hypothetical protein NQ315_007066 [Exocentrus adspersus]|uniref:Uncharacterized protein n=1 Tax=Exocentrus adspersus TaxID=1586481 RepID=A0AAV8WCL5_9CUCU|nr:hypothetical protein NQ315_007066 [Exocentrus adspersus]
MHQSKLILRVCTIIWITAVTARADYEYDDEYDNNEEEFDNHPLAEFPTLPPLLENICTVDVIKEESRTTTCDYNGNNCDTSLYIVSKTLLCINISIHHLDSYTEGEESSFPYPLILKLKDSVIPLLPTASFKHLNRVTVLYLEKVNLTTVMPGAFNFLDKLTEIHLGGNNLTSISDRIFNSLTVLEKLDLSRNRIQTVSDHAFAGVALKSLNLNSNNISSTSKELMQSLNRLSNLDMSQNRLQDISSFYDLPVRRLNLSHNRIEAVDFVFFQKITIFLDLSYNNITEITSFNSSQISKVILSHNRIKNFEKNNHVTVLKLSHNRLESIGSGLFNNGLTIFDAGFNFISSLSDDAFFGLHDLKELYLNNNNITAIPNPCFKDLTSLTHLNLGGNKLTSFNFGTFDNLVSLEVLDISNNNFKELPQYTLHSLRVLTHLFFENNEISNINTDDLVQHLPYLKVVALNGNVWSCHSLVRIIHKLKNSHVLIPRGDSWDVNNIHGIRCYETDQNGFKSSSGNVSDESKLNRFFNEDFTKTILYKYFNQDFKQSEFFKYLESLRRFSNSKGNASQDSKIRLSDGDFTKSEMYNYFNKDFRNNSFFEYFENFKNEGKNTEKADFNKLGKVIANSFKDVVSDLKNISMKDDLYNYFNKDFKTSNFFKYLETLNVMSLIGKSSANISDSRIEKLVSSYENTNVQTNYSGLLYVIAILLFVIVSIMAAKSFRRIFKTNKYSFSDNEGVELICKN